MTTDFAPLYPPCYVRGDHRTLVPTFQWYLSNHFDWLNRAKATARHAAIVGNIEEANLAEEEMQHADWWITATERTIDMFRRAERIFRGGQQAELRHAPPAGVEYRIASANAGPMTVTQDRASDGYRISGYGAVFDSAAPITIPGGSTFSEVIRQGAFTRSLRERPDVRLLHSHDARWVLARAPRTLTLSQDSKGLWFSAILPSTAIGKDTAESIRRGDISGCSFSFTTPKGGDRFSSVGGRTLRELHDIDLHEVSVVAWPAYPATTVSMGDSPGRSAPVDDIEARLRARQRALGLVGTTIRHDDALARLQARERALGLVGTTATPDDILTRLAERERALRRIKV